eukprot:1229406-Rhodomonas_salina.1
MRAEMRWEKREEPCPSCRMPASDRQTDRQTDSATPKSDTRAPTHGIQTDRQTDRQHMASRQTAMAKR